jgi:hypothetical protein
MFKFGIPIPTVWTLTEWGQKKGKTMSLSVPIIKQKARLWKLKRLDEVVKVTHSDVIRRSDEEKEARDYESFLQEIESDSNLRKGINLYKNHEAIERASERAALQRQHVGR